MEPAPKVQRERGFAGYAGRWIAWVCCLLAGAARAEPPPLREYDLKAALLYNVAKYSDWPDEAFATPADPIVIGVLGENPFGDVLRRIVQGRTINGRAIVVRHATGLAALHGSHLVFISASEASRAAELSLALERAHAVSVSDTPQSAAFTAVNLAVRGDKVVFSVHLGRVTRARVTISSRLLHLAEAVTGREKDAL
jgi:hypothetical protein